MTAMTVLTAGLSMAATSKDVCVLTYNSNIWKTVPMEVAGRFPHFQWEQDAKGFTAKSADGLQLWGLDVLSANVSGSSNTTSLNILIYEETENEALGNAEFFKAATSWKTKMDQKMGRKGVMLDKSYAGVSVVQTVAWEFSESVVTLTTVVGKTPEKMYIRMYAKSAASSVLAKLHKPAKGSKKSGGAIAKKASGANQILKKLKGKTTYLEGGSFSKRDISSDTEYYIVYFSASW